MERRCLPMCLLEEEVAVERETGGGGEEEDKSKVWLGELRPEMKPSRPPPEEEVAVVVRSGLFGGRAEGSSRLSSLKKERIVPRKPVDSRRAGTGTKGGDAADMRSSVERKSERNACFVSGRKGKKGGRRRARGYWDLLYC